MSYYAPAKCLISTIKACLQISEYSESVIGRAMKIKCNLAAKAHHNYVRASRTAMEHMQKKE
jgi:hypothetical protein